MGAGAGSEAPRRKRARWGVCLGHTPAPTPALVCLRPPGLTLGVSRMLPSIMGEQSDHSHCTRRRCGHMPVISRYTGMEKSTSPARRAQRGCSSSESWVAGTWVAPRVRALGLGVQAAWMAVHNDTFRGASTHMRPSTQLTLLALGAQVCDHDRHLPALDRAAVVHAPGRDAAPAGGALVPLQAGQGARVGNGPPVLSTRPCPASLPLLLCSHAPWAC